MFSKSHPIILFLDRNGFSVYQDALTNIPKFNFTSDLVENLDVVSKEKFSNLIATFIQINKIAPSSLGIILSDNVVYFKDLINTSKEDVQNFLEDIPFEEVLAKVIKTDQLNRIVAVNKDLVMTISDAFVNKGSVAEAVIPSFLYGPVTNFSSGLTQNNVQAILAGSEVFKIGNLLTDQEKMISPSNMENEQKNPQSNGQKKPQNLRQYILAGIFVALLIILAVVYLNLGVSQNPPVKKIKSASAETVSSSLTVPTVTPASTSQTLTATPVDLKSISIKILPTSQSDAIANNLKNDLLQGGFQDIIIQTPQNNIPEKSSIVFSQNIAQDLRNNIVAQVTKILPGIAVLQNQDSNLIITIILGKS